MKTTITILLLMALLGCRDDGARVDSTAELPAPVKKVIHDVPPPGYSIVCDTNGNFAPRQDNIGYVMNVFVSRSKQEAIDSVWQYDEHIKKPENQWYPPTNYWRKCD